VSKPAPAKSIVVDYHELLRAARLCSAVAEQKSPVLAYQSTLVRISVEGCDLSATSGTVSIRSIVGLEAMGGIAAFCVNAKRLVDVLARTPDGRIRIEPSDGEVRISNQAARVSVKLSTTPATNWPEVIWPDALSGRSVDRVSFANALIAARVAVNSFDVDPTKNSIRLDVTDGMLSAWAINGHVLAVYGIDFPGAGQSSLHASAVDAFVSALSSSDTPFASAEIGDATSVRTGKTVVIARSTGASRPPWKQLIPPDPMVVTCDRSGLLDAADRAGMFAAKDHPDIVLHVDDDGLRVSRGGRGDGSASTVVEVDGDRKPGTEIRLNWRYLRDCLAAVDSERVDVAIAGPLKPFVIRPAGVADGQLYLISPMTAKGE